jgi:hypothetical protein
MNEQQEQETLTQIANNDPKKLIQSLKDEIIKIEKEAEDPACKGCTGDTVKKKIALLQEKIRFIRNQKQFRLMNIG